MAHTDGNGANATRGRRPKGQGPDLREAILDAAEALFSRHGFYGVTVRQVATEAGVDTALIHYYFGAKSQLFDAVFARRAEILNAMRLKAMGDYEQAHAGALTVEGVIDAMELEDGPRSLKLYHVVKLVHSDSMLIAYLPKEKILFTADFNAPAPGQPVSPSIAVLMANLDRLAIDFERHVTVHAPNPDRVLTKADLFELAKRITQ